MTTVNRQIQLAERPFGIPKVSDFKLVEEAIPEACDGQFLVRIHYLSVDPYMRGLLTGAKTYMKPVRPGDLMIGSTVGRVAESKHPKYKVGDVVVGQWGWQEYAVSDGHNVEKFDATAAPMTTALGVLGMPGMTAYFGLLEIGRPRPGETVFVSGAAGAVGSTVGQIAKLCGCRVAGSAGSDAKVEYLTKELGFDAAFNYKATDNYVGAIREVCPDGIDVYFDNVGGPITDAAFTRINLRARIVLCGQIAQYNVTETPMGPRALFLLVTRQARAEGFMVTQFADRRDEWFNRMSEWVTSGKVKHRETIVDGIENAPKAFIALFTGGNVGKELVRVAPE